MGFQTRNEMAGKKLICQSPPRRFGKFVLCALYEYCKVTSFRYLSLPAKRCFKFAAATTVTNFTAALRRSVVDQLAGDQITQDFRVLSSHIRVDADTFFTYNVSITKKRTLKIS